MGSQRERKESNKILRSLLGNAEIEGKTKKRRNEETKNDGKMRGSEHPSPPPSFTLLPLHEQSSMPRLSWDFHRHGEVLDIDGHQIEALPGAHKPVYHVAYHHSQREAAACLKYAAVAEPRLHHEHASQLFLHASEHPLVDGF